MKDELKKIGDLLAALRAICRAVQAAQVFASMNEDDARKAIALRSTANAEAMVPVAGESITLADVLDEIEQHGQKLIGPLTALSLGESDAADLSRLVREATSKGLRESVALLEAVGEAA